MLVHVDSLLCNILGLYCIDGICFMIMKSVLYSENIQHTEMHKIYDLKGSTHKRAATRWKLLLDTKDFETINDLHLSNINKEIEEDSENDQTGGDPDDRKCVEEDAIENLREELCDGIRF